MLCKIISNCIPLQKIYERVLHMKNYAFYMTELNSLEKREIPIPVPEDDEILLKLEYVGICGSDVHYLETGRIGDFIVDRDFILGHECAGTVTDVGANVKNLKRGDRVALEPGCTCGQCKFCKSGKYNLCPNVKFLATPPYDGCLMNYMAFPANMAFKLPDNITTKEGALIEPLCVGLHAATQGNVRPGNSVTILGAGCIGLVTLLACKAFGATQIIVADVIEKRLNFAKRMGAHAIINASQSDVIEQVMALTGGIGTDIVIETAGSDITLSQTSSIVTRGGRIVLVGMGSDIVPYNFSTLMAKEADIKTVFRYRNLYPTAIRLVAGGNIKISDIVTHEFDFEETPKAFLEAIRNKRDVVKAVIRF